MERLTGLLGVLVFIGLAYGLSRDRRRIHWPTVAWGLGLQWLLAVVVLRGGALSQGLAFLPFPKGTGWAVLGLLLLPWILKCFARFEHRALTWSLRGLALLGIIRGNLLGASFDRIRLGVQKLMAYGLEGARFVFGSLADEKGPAAFVFAFQVLPVIIFVGSLFAILYYLGIMQRVVAAGARALGKVMRVTGAESVCAVANVFMGQTEAPLTVKPYLAGLTRSELMTVMVTGMASVSGSIMVTYVQVANVDIVHLLTAALMSAPAALVFAKIMEPESENRAWGGEVNVDVLLDDANVLDAAARGASEGLHLAINVAGMLIAFIALMAMINGGLKLAHPELTLEGILGFLFRPVAWLIGVPWSEAGAIGTILGKKMVLNEIVAFLDLKAATGLAPRTFMITTFAVTGFANFSSIAIQLGGIGALIPGRRGDLARLGFKAMLAATLANFTSACVAGVLG